MKFEFFESDLLSLYDNAKASFKECINNKDNDFLLKEVNIPLDKIMIVEKGVKIIISKRDFITPFFEISLLLTNGSKEIGKYVYVENAVKQAIDDSLVFY